MEKKYKVVPFSIEKFEELKECVYTVEGHKVEQFTKYTFKDGSHRFVGVLDGISIRSWDSNGCFYSNNLLDLEFREEVKEYWLNLYQRDGKYFLDRYVYPSEVEALDSIENRGLYIQTFKVTR